MTHFTFCITVSALMLSAASLPAQGAATPQAGQADTTVRIVLVSTSESEEEGGSMDITYYPTGDVRVDGHESGRGYVPRIRPGWYRIDTKTLQAYFTAAAKLVTSSPREEAVPESELGRGYWYSTSVKTTVQGYTFRAGLDVPPLFGHKPRLTASPIQHSANWIPKGKPKVETRVYR